jgi:hypothetical protein
MVHFIEDASTASGTEGIDVGRFFFLMAFNLIGNLMFSKDLLDPKSERGAKFFFHAGKVMEFAGKPNVADFLPILRLLDPQGIRRKTQFHVERAFEIAGGFIAERMESMENGRNEEIKRKDYLDALLEFRGDGVEEPLRFSSRTINVVVFVSHLFFLLFFSFHANLLVLRACHIWICFLFSTVYSKIDESSCTHICIIVLISVPLTKLH